MDRVLFKTNQLHIPMLTCILCENYFLALQNDYVYLV
jgi:hypothetical protein